MLVDLSKPTRIFVYTNSKVGFDKTGRQGVIVYQWIGDDNRLVLRMARPFGFTANGDVGVHVPSYTIAIKGEMKNLPMLEGEAENILIENGLKALSAIRELGEKAKTWNSVFVIDVNNWSARKLQPENRPSQRKAEPNSSQAANVR